MSPVAPLNTLGVYKGLSYNAFVVSQTLVGVAPGVPPHSLKNSIATTQVTSQALQGTPSIAVDLSSKVVSYDLFSFWFGCVLPLAQSSVNTATQCTILVAGFDVNNKEKAAATFTFTPIATQLTNTPMILAKLPSIFTGLRNVTVVQSNPTTQVLKIDSFKYTTYSS